MVSQLSEQLYKERDESGDVTFIVESQRIRVHRCILAASSSTYKSDFFSLDSDEDDITLSNVSASAFNEFIKCFYSLPMNLSKENVDTILGLAVKSQFNACIIECEFFLKNCGENNADLCWVYTLAMNHNLTSVQSFCDHKIATNTLEVFQSNGFTECGYKVLMRILNNPSLECNEIEVLRACISWAKASHRRNHSDDGDALDWRKVVGDAVILIRFASMKIHEFNDFYKEYEGFFCPEEIIEISSIIFQHHLESFKPKKFNTKPRQNSN